MDDKGDPTIDDSDPSEELLKVVTLEIELGCKNADDYAKTIGARVGRPINIRITNATT